MRWRLVPALLVLAAIAPARALPPSQVPDESGAFVGSVQKGDDVELFCNGLPPQDLPDTYFVALSAALSDGTVVGGEFQGYDSVGGYFVSAGLVGHQVSVEPNHPGDSPGYFVPGAGWVADQDAVVHLAWASWGGRVECHLVLNGYEIEPARIDGASFATPSDFFGIGVTTTFGAGGVGQLTRDVHGFEMAFLVVDAGVGQITSPDGRTWTARPPLAFAGVAEPSDGTWTYAIAGAHPLARLVLWTIELAH